MLVVTLTVLFFVVVFRFFVFFLLDRYAKHCSVLVTYRRRSSAGLADGFVDRRHTEKLKASVIAHRHIDGTSSRLGITEFAHIGEMEGSIIGTFDIVVLEVVVVVRQMKLSCGKTNCKACFEMSGLEPPSIVRTEIRPFNNIFNRASRSCFGALNITWSEIALLEYVTVSFCSTILRVSKIVPRQLRLKPNVTTIGHRHYFLPQKLGL